MLQALTEELLDECKECWQRFLKMRETNTSPDFFADVKPHANLYHEKLLAWKSEVDIWIDQEKPKYIHKIQIQNAVDAMDQLIVQSFYQKTSKKRLYQSIQSVTYTLENLQRILQKDDSDDQ
ncbi:YppE family protein [Rummeliibacillus sp. SL167]|uniref:YppE family protein n=1 Tax=Rummeliibacillus sp. SL167 TaxID=2579792 RepID=UPI0011B549FA|nr:YppE family protein [Rummeliibacillus sp. SL167]